MSVRTLGTEWWETWLFRLLYKIEVSNSKIYLDKITYILNDRLHCIIRICFLKIHLINEHLFCKYFVRLYTWYNTKDIKVKILTIRWKVSWFLLLICYFSTFIFHYLYTDIKELCYNVGNFHLCCYNFNSGYLAKKRVMPVLLVYCGV